MQIVIAVLALVLILIPINLYLKYERDVITLVEVGVTVDPWQRRILLYLEAISLGCFLAALIRSRRSYMIASVFLLCQVGVLVYWYVKVMRLLLYPYLSVSAFFFSDKAIENFKDNIGIFAQAGIVLLLLGLILWQRNYVEDVNPGSS